MGVYYLSHRLGQIAETTFLPSETAKVSFQRSDRVIDLPKGTSDVILKLTNESKSSRIRHSTIDLLYQVLPA